MSDFMEIVAPLLEAILIEVRDEVVVSAIQEQAITIEVKTETVIVTPEPEVVVIEVRRGPKGLQGDKGEKGDTGARGQTDFPDGTNTGDIIRYNAITGDWESCAEPFEFKGIVLIPMALPGSPVDGLVGFNIVDNGLYVAIPD